MAPKVSRAMPNRGRVRIIRAWRSNELASCRPRSVWERSQAPVLQAPSVLCNLRASNGTDGAELFGLGGFDQSAQREDQFGHLGVGQRVRIDRLQLVDHVPQTHVRRLPGIAANRT